MLEIGASQAPQSESSSESKLNLSYLTNTINLDITEVLDIGFHNPSLTPIFDYKKKLVLRET